MNKDLGYYLNLKYPLVIREDEENGKTIYLLEIPDLPGCGAEGETLEEAKGMLEEAKKLWIEESLKRGLPIPEPGEEENSGRILLRIQPFFHGQLRKRARQAGVSLNKYISATLESGLTLSVIFEKIESLGKDINEIKSKLEQRPIKEKVPALEEWVARCATGTAVLSGESYPFPGAHITPTGTSGLYSMNWSFPDIAFPRPKALEFDLSSSKDHPLLKGEINEKEKR